MLSIKKRDKILHQCAVILDHKQPSKLSWGPLKELLYTVWNKREERSWIILGDGLCSILITCTVKNYTQWTETTRWKVEVIIPVQYYTATSTLFEYTLGNGWNKVTAYKPGSWTRVLKRYYKKLVAAQKSQALSN